MTKQVRKKKKDDEVSRLEKEIRELKSENRTLHKRLKKVDKHYREVIEIEDEAPKVIQQEICSECERGYLVTIRLAGREFKRCPMCNWRGNAKKVL